jgi:hypothetical protein
VQQHVIISCSCHRSGTELEIAVIDSDGPPNQWLSHRPALVTFLFDHPLGPYHLLGVRIETDP